MPYNNSKYALFCDCGAGISGDMFLAALINLGVSKNELYKMLQTLPVGPFEINSKICSVSGINAIRFNVEWDEKKQINRNIKSIVQIIRSSGLSPSVKERSERVFWKLAEAEAKVHGTDVQKIHFHEVGAVDSIVDIVGAVLGMELLGATDLVFPTLKLGSGYVNCQHGRIPVPAPATLELLKGLDVVLNTGEGEKITPTGAALLSVLGRQVSGNFAISPKKTGYGAGTRVNGDVPNLLRLIYGTVSKNDNKKDDEIILLETDIDDMNPQWLGGLMEKLFSLGALDVVFIPIQMKKNRPATRINVLCKEEDKPLLLETIFRESTTLGIRYNKVMRHCLDREMSCVKTLWGEVKIKKAYLNGDLVQQQPEYEDMKKIATETNNSLKEIYQTVISFLEK